MYQSLLAPLDQLGQEEQDGFTWNTLKHHELGNLAVHEN